MLSPNGRRQDIGPDGGRSWQQQEHGRNTDYLIIIFLLSALVLLNDSLLFIYMAVQKRIGAKKKKKYGTKIAGRIFFYILFKKTKFGE